MWHANTDWINGYIIAVGCSVLFLFAMTAGCGEASETPTDDGIEDHGELLYCYSSGRLTCASGTDGPTDDPLMVGSHLTVAVQGSDTPGGGWFDHIADVHIADPEVLEVVAFGDGAIELVAQAPGTTTVEIIPDDEVGAVENTSFELEVASLEQIDLEPGCGHSSNLDRRDALEIDNVWLAGSETSVLISLYDQEGRELVGATPRSQHVSVEPEGSLIWPHGTIYAGISSFTVETDVDEVEIAPTTSGSGFTLPVVDEDEIAPTTSGSGFTLPVVDEDEIEIGLYRFAKEEHNRGDFIPFDSDLEIEVYSGGVPNRGGDPNRIDLLEDDRYTFVPVRLVGDAFLCRPASEGNTWPDYMPDYRVKSETPEVCGFSEPGSPDDQYFIREEVTTEYRVQLRPIAEGACRFTVTYLDGVLEGESEQWIWPIEF